MGDRAASHGGLAERWARVLGDLKSRAARRTIDIPDDMARLIGEWISECPDGELLFPNWEGHPENRSNVANRCWYPLQIAVGLIEGVTSKGEPKPRYDFHSLRHFRASMLIASGANPKEVQTEMGHSSIKVTYDTYGHLFPEDRAHRQRRAEEIARLLGPEIDATNTQQRIVIDGNSTKFFPTSRTENPRVGGSIPSLGTIPNLLTQCYL